MSPQPRIEASSCNCFAPAQRCRFSSPSSLSPSPPGLSNSRRHSRHDGRLEAAPPEMDTAHSSPVLARSDADRHDDAPSRTSPAPTSLLFSHDPYHSRTQEGPHHAPLLRPVRLHSPSAIARKGIPRGGQLPRRWIHVGPSYRRCKVVPDAG